MSTRDVAKKAIREQIAAAALKRFRDNGFDQTTVEDIAVDVGMSVRTFFRYFSSKEDVVLEAAEDFKRVCLANFEANLLVKDLWLAMGDALEQTIAKCRDDDPRHTGLEVQTLIQQTPTLLARQLEIFERLQIEVTECFLTKAENQQAYGWTMAHAIVRSGFACWHAVQKNESFGRDGDNHSPIGLHELMEQMRPWVLDNNRK